MWFMEVCICMYVSLCVIFSPKSFPPSSFCQSGHCANQIQVLRTFFLDHWMVLKKEEVFLDNVSVP